MKKHSLGTTAAIVLVAAGIALSAGKSNEQAIRDLDVRWSKAAQNKDAAKTASFYAETASALPFNAPIVTGKDHLEQMWSELMAKPGYALHFEPTSIVVSKSKDMAYDIGTFELKLNDAQGKPMTLAGKYVVVWAKQADGQWKVQADCFNTDK